MRRYRRKQIRDRIGRWLIRHQHERAADYLALLVMGPGARPAEDLLPLWRERWTVRQTEVPGDPGDDLNPRVTADVGAVRLMAMLAAERQAGPGGGGPAQFSDRR